VIDLLRVHLKWALLAALVLGLAAGGAAAWRLKPTPAPIVKTEYRTRDLTETERAALIRTVTVEGPTHVVTGPTHVIERWRTISTPAPTSTPSPAPGALDCSSILQAERETWTSVIDSINSGSSSDTTASASSTERHEAQAERIVIPQPPAPLPRWSLAGGVHVGTELQPRPVAGLGVRLLGPVWVEATVTPTKPEATAGFRVTF
jgi:hypothetical protein